MEKKYTNTANLLTFILGSAFGIIMFLVPVPHGATFTTLLDFFCNFLKKSFGASLPYLVTGCVTFAGAVSLYDYIFKPAWIREHDVFSKVFSSSPLYLCSKVLGAIFAIMCLFKVGPEYIISVDTGATMLGLCNTLFCIVLSFSFIMPFLTDCGIMEFLGVIMRPVVHPLFRVPGRASVDLMASWFGASNAAVILTREQYNRGFYTKREAGYIMTNFSLVSIPFCLIIATTIGIEQYFPAFYLCICLVGIILAAIIARIPPISTVPNTYRESVGKNLDEHVPEDVELLPYAVEMACRRANSFGIKGIISGGMEVTLGMLFDLIPIVLSWGILALMVATYTPIFQWLSYPMGMYLNVLGVADAFKVAPATLVGFADMFIPALLITGIESVETKFIIGVLSLVQIIYMTEVGAIIIKSEVPLNCGKLVIIFLERTIIAIPLIVAFARLVF